MAFKRAGESGLTERIATILAANTARNTSHQSLTLDIDVQLRLIETEAIKFQIACVVLEELAGLAQEQALPHLFLIGLETVLHEAAQGANSIKTKPSDRLIDGIPPVEIDTPSPKIKPNEPNLRDQLRDPLSVDLPFSDFIDGKTVN